MKGQQRREKVARMRVKAGGRLAALWLAGALILASITAVVGCGVSTAGNNGSKCPECGSGDVVPIVYGLPGQELQQQAERGEVVLGG
jgi:hypothetical protein